MQAIILAGGMGTRLRPLTYTVPKPMLPIAGVPAMMHTVGALYQAGFDEVFITTNYLADAIDDGIKTFKPPIPVRCIREEKPLGTAGCVKNLIDELADEFVIIQGDAVADIDYKRFLLFHRQCDADVSIATMRVSDPREFGIVGIESDARISRFQEKPKPEEAFSNLASSGFYILKKKHFDRVPEGEPFDFSRQLFPDLMANNARFYSWEMNSYWVDIGRVQNYLEGNRHRMQGRAEVADGVHVPDSTKLVPPFLIQEGTRIGEGCIIGPNATVGRGCIIGDGARLSGALLFDDVAVGANARLTDCVLARHARLGAGVNVDPLAVIGESCTLGDDVAVAAYSRVGPVVTVASGTEVEGVFAPRGDKLENLQNVMSRSPQFANLPQEQFVACSVLATFGEMTAREIANKGPIPFSKVRDVLEVLEESGVVLSTLDVPKRFALAKEF
jgi:NDP-sugar pyrophosphorylase family protein